MSQSIKDIRERAAAHYAQRASVYCPYFKEEIALNSAGFNHIRYRQARKERHVEVQKIRYKLLPLAIEVINNSKTLQEQDEKNLFIEVKNRKKRQKIMKNIQFYGFIAIIRNFKLKVIVRQVEKGKKHFWSVIPNWKTRRTKNGQKRIQHHTGDLAQD